jgi:hypothetical protein
MAEDIRQSTNKQTSSRQNTKSALNNSQRDHESTRNHSKTRNDNRNANRNNGNNNNYNNNRAYERTRFSNNHRKNQQKTAQNEPETEENRRKKLLSTCSSTGGGVTCVCCLHDLSTFAYYACSHFVCLKCAVKMRVLCEKIDCPVCRQESKQIYCVKSEIDMTSLQASIEKCTFMAEKSGICFENRSIQAEYEQILANQCNICSNLFASFDELERHVRVEHRKFYCELCLTHLKLFPYERKAYNREDLAVHKRVGDKDDYSFKGHPLCEYCDQRFFDRDEIYRHYRKEHYYCHFCDNDGHEEYYKDYAQLRVHFLKSHYLCELDSCSANAAQTHEYVVFRSELDFLAHKKQKHAKSKSDMKSFGKINIEFNVSNPHRDKKTQRRGGGGGGGSSGFGRGARNYSPDEEVQQSLRNFGSDQPIRPHQQSSSRTSRQAESNTASSIFDLAQFEPLSVEETKKADSVSTDEKFVPNDTNLPNIAAQATSSTLIDQAEESKKTSVQSHQSGWSTILGAGSTPKINTESEFPSLNPSTQPMSLSQIGAFIGKSSAWNKSNVKNSPNTATTQNKEKKVNPFPDLSETNAKSSLLDANWIKDDEKKAKKHKKKKANESKSTTESDEQLKPSPPVPPPPGFEMKTLDNFSDLNIQSSSLQVQPPPGFASKKPLDISTTAVTTAQEQLAREYIKPNDYEKRNQELSLQLVELFPPKHFEQFKTLSVSFRKNELDASNYLDKCLDLLDMRKNELVRGKFLDLVQEMIVLLPDIDKQSVLFDHFERLFNKKSKQSASDANVMNIVKCVNCGQYFQKDELFSHHYDRHGGQIVGQSSSSTNKKQQSSLVESEDFPALKPHPVSNAFATSSTTMSSIFKNAADSKEEKKTTKSEKAKTNVEEEDFPALSTIPSELLSQNRFSALPTPSIFSNPSSHLSILNKKKHRLQK